MVLSPLLSSTLFILLVFCLVLLGIMVIARSSVGGEDRNPQVREVRQQMWQRMLRQWGIAVNKNDEAIVVNDVRRAWETLHPKMYVYAYMLLALFTTIIIVADAVWLPSLGIAKHVAHIWMYFMLAMFFTLMLVMRETSYVSGITRLRRQAMGRVTYGDLRQRRLTDYCSPLFPIVTILLIVYHIATGLLLWPYLSPLILVLIPRLSVIVFPTLWVEGIVLAAMLLAFVVIELLSRRIATFSRTLITANPTLARQVDDMFRARVIGELQGDRLIVVGYLAGVQSYLLLAAVTSHVPLYVHNILLMSVWAMSLTILLGLLGYVLTGKLGGKVTGWPWKRVKA